MKLVFDDIIDKHKGIPAAIALHGPSLDRHKEQIQVLQRQNKILRFSVNDWYNFLNEKPDYWVVSNTEFTIGASISRNHIWEQRKYPRDVFNQFGIPLLYNATADLTDLEIVDKKMKCDYLPYDTKHFKGHRCIQILKNFKNYYEQNRNLEFTYYGNNSSLWSRPNIDGFPEWMKRLHGRIGSAWDATGKCCKYIGPKTLQEALQEYTGHTQHMGTGQTVGLFSVAFAVIMGCNPIYITGLDLDCSLGYANGSNPLDQYNAGHMGHWKTIFREVLLNDMRILDESARLVGTKIVNLNENSWHDIFLKEKLSL
jgi:hypothetical protein